MSRTRSLLCAAPGVALGVAGLWHPAHLTADTAQRWWVLHLLGCFVFPMVGIALVALVWGRRDVVAVVVTVLAYVYATAYTGLDVISGIAAGFVTSRLPAGAARPDEVRSLFAIGTPLGHVGSVALVLAAALLTLDAVRRHGVVGTVGLLVVVGALMLHRWHIYPPYGSAGIALVGLGTGCLAGIGTMKRGRVSLTGPPS